MAELIVNLSRLRHNIQVVQELCARSGIEMVAVAKGCCGFLPIIKTFQESGIRIVGFSRVADAVRAAPFLSDRPCFISLPSPGLTHAVIQHFGSSLHSELVTIQALVSAAEQNARAHGIILMVDIGDLREGVMPEDVVPAVQSILEIRSQFVEFLGIGATLGCCSGTLPDDQNLGLLHELAIDIEGRIGCQIKTVSIGGSVIIPWIENCSLPSRINQVRIGEAILLGNIPTIDKRHEALSSEVFLLRGTVLETRAKPSKPPGRQGKDVLGQQLTFADRGPRLRCILDFGIIDTDPNGLIPVSGALEFINANSDYTIMDVTAANHELKPGDMVDFHLNYQALIRAFQARNLDITVTGAEQAIDNGFLKNPDSNRCW
jgi:predicted amino acid racemase